MFCLIVKGDIDEVDSRAMREDWQEVATLALPTSECEVAIPFSRPAGNCRLLRRRS